MGSGKKQPILGALAGSVLGFFGVALGLFAVRDVFGLAGDQIRPFLWSVTIGCSLLGCFLGYWANWTLKGRLKQFATGTLAGVIVGLLIGVAVSEFVVERAIVAAYSNRDDPLFGKMNAPTRSTYRYAGLGIGAATGALFGAGIGLRGSSNLNRAIDKPLRE